MSKEKLMKESEGTAIADRSVNKTLDGLTASATVDTNTGTPEVSVTTENLTGVKKLKFAFKNLKGQKGDKGSPGDTGVGVSKVAAVTTSTADGGTSTYRITLTNGNTFDFNVKNGSKGSKGSDANTNDCLKLKGGTLTGPLKFNGGSVTPAQIIPSATNLVIKGPFDTTEPVNADYDRQTGFDIRTCKHGILPLYQDTEFGSPTCSFGHMYANGFSQTSDKKLKKDISLLDDEFETLSMFFDGVDFVKFRWKDNHNLAMETPASSRYHYGVIAQSTEDLMRTLGLSNYDNGIIHSDFFLDNTSNGFISGGYRCAKEDYDYSQNVWNYKHGDSYEVCNEIIEKSCVELDDGGRYKHRSKIQYILIQDISKVRSQGKQPPLTINSIGFVDKEGEFIQIPLSTEGAISCYNPDDENFERPGSSGVINDDGSLTVSFEDMWASYMIKIGEDDNCPDIYEFESVIADIDFIGEYKIYLIPEGNYQNCNFWNDRDRADEVVYDYTLNYQEITNMSLAVLQKTRKDYVEYKKATESAIEDMQKQIRELKDTLTSLSGGDKA